MTAAGGKIFLIGMMGAGKTTVGLVLAGRLGIAYLDSDAEIQRRTGRTVPEIFAADGEAAFRAQEADVLADAVHREDRVVVAVAGGAILDPANRELLRGAGSIVWLRAAPATLALRVGDGTGRPLLDGDDKAATLTHLDEVRRPIYETLADVTIDVDGRSPDEIADLVLAGVAA